MPWYDDDDKEGELNLGQTRESQDHGATGPRVDWRERDPYLCTLEIRLPRDEVPKVKSLYSPLLQWIDPTFQLLHIEESNKKSFITWFEQDGPKEKASKSHLSRHHLNTQSLSVVLFLHEESKCQLNAEFAKGYLQSPPWGFHHKIELANPKDMRTVARQDYYGSSPDLPLWTVCSVHYGNEQLRFNIFVKNFEKMKEFYGVLTGCETSASKPGFCSFDLYSQPGLEIKLSLKYSPCLQPHASQLSALNFNIRNVLYIKQKLRLTLIPNGDNTWLARDPDGNAIILSRDENDVCEMGVEGHSTEASDSGQWSETVSEDSSCETCSDTSCTSFSCESGCESVSTRDEDEDSFLV
ncbi:protein FAM124A-like isoform X2 [Stylophora pistillata]|nr:protein FAM124A-like isoform X2 [Stylophora pistillata]XP_022794302.1 protein FAM124A-like isoform X2 [Stylophora pistillata]XP_022794310.1 protein FAM124A-like isoform X2 [Stylophora pistillata]